MLNMKSTKYIPWYLVPGTWYIDFTSSYWFCVDDLIYIYGKIRPTERPTIY